MLASRQSKILSIERVTYVANRHGKSGVFEQAITKVSAKIACLVAYSTIPERKEEILVA